MPWREVSVVDERREFVRLALMEGANRRELCRRFGISADVAYKWLGRFQSGDEALADRSRRPLNSPARTCGEMERAVLAVRGEHPAWGGRKIAAVLRRQGLAPPAASTITRILDRHGLELGAFGGGEASFTRFERASPNELWQMDFKGWVTLKSGERCHPLTVIDDHSRFCPCLKACADQKGAGVKAHLEETFRHHGLPQAFFVDNGQPWGDVQGDGWTRLGVWLLKLGVEVINGRPYHPQGRGKIERFHRSLVAEVLDLAGLKDNAHAQAAFDRWRDVYNFERPHEALGQQSPASRYRPSSRAMPDTTPQPQYDSADIVRRVDPSKPFISFKGRSWRVSKAFMGERLAIRPSGKDGQYGVFFASHQIGRVDLTKPKPVSHVSEQVSAMSPV